MFVEHGFLLQEENINYGHLGTKCPGKGLHPRRMKYMGFLMMSS
jgi:hypothetical protein